MARASAPGAGQSAGVIGSGIKTVSAPVASGPKIKSGHNPSSKMAVARSGRRLLDFGRTWASTGHLLKSARNFLPGNLQPEGKSQARMPSLRMLQGELLLENIKVVRNDLSDPDWEIVTKKETKRAVAPVPPAVPVAQTRNSDTAWGRVGARLFGAGKQ